MRRIKSVGGEVISISGTWRVNGNLAVSRAIGKFSMLNVLQCFKWFNSKCENENDC